METNIWGLWWINSLKEIISHFLNIFEVYTTWFFNDEFISKNNNKESNFSSSIYHLMRSLNTLIMLYLHILDIQISRNFLWFFSIYIKSFVTVSDHGYAPVVIWVRNCQKKVCDRVMYHYAKPKKVKTHKSPFKQTRISPHWPMGFT